MKTKTKLDCVIIQITNTNNMQKFCIPNSIGRDEINDYNDVM